jgi:wyosine [tRNA(Phe)-imidazoG37] synthetase (radical SAM superfamily)
MPAQIELPVRTAAGPSALQTALDEIHRNNALAGLAIFADVFRDGLKLPEDEVAGVMIEVSSALIAAFETDRQSPAAYDFLRTISPEAADVVAGLLQLANFPTGNENLLAIQEPIILAFAGALSAAGRHKEAIGILEGLLVRTPNRLPLSHAMFVAQRRQAGQPDDLRGRFCEVPFEGFDVLPGGAVHLCCAAFMSKSVGNLYHQDHDSIWNGEDAGLVRESIHDGSFRYCDKLKCPRFAHGLPTACSALEAATAAADAVDHDWMARRGSVPHNPHLAPIIAGSLTELTVPPAKINLSFDRTCNLACPSCRTDFIAAKSAERASMLTLVNARILPLLETASLVTVTGSGDPFASKTFRHILRSIDPERCPDLKVQIATNGVLFTPQEWEGIAHLHGRIAGVNVSIDAACPETYAIVRRGGDWDRLLANLRFLTSLARQGAFAAVNLCFVVQALNWREMPAFVRLGRELGVDQVYFSLLENWGTFHGGQFADNAVHFESHPDHQDFRELLATSPEMDDPLVWLGSSIPSLRETPVTAGAAGL